MKDQLKTMSRLVTLVSAALALSATAYGGAITPTTYEVPGASAVYSLSFDSSGNLWATGVFGGQTAVAQINPANGSVINTYTTSGFAPYIEQTTIDSAGNLYIPAGNELWEFNTVTDTFTSFSSVGGNALYGENGISIDSNGTFWMAGSTVQGGVGVGDILSFSSPTGSATAYTVNTQQRGLNFVLAIGSDVIYSVDNGGTYTLGLFDTSTLSSDSNIPYSPLTSIAGGGTLDGFDTAPAMDALGDVYTIDQPNVHGPATLYRLDLATDLWDPVEQLGAGDGYGSVTLTLIGTRFTFDSAGDLFAASNDGNGATIEVYGAGTPEPGTWALMVSGLVGVGIGIRRRR